MTKPFRTTLLGAGMGLLALQGCSNEAVGEQPAAAVAGANSGGSSAAGARTTSLGGKSTFAGASNTSGGTSSSRGGATASSGGNAGGAATTASTGETLRVSGNRILDTCGNPLVIRGVEQLLSHALDINNSLQPLLDGIVASGANAVRILPDQDTLTATEIDAIIATFQAAQMVVYVTADKPWFARPEIKAALDKHKAWIILDAYGEPSFDDRVRWKSEAIAAIQTVRGYGYTCPITVIANQFGRDLPSLVLSGNEVVAADPIKNTIMGWQAYWGVSGWYQNNAYHMTLAEGVTAAATQAFPVQIGIDQYADPEDIMDYASVMAAAQQQAVGWLWWNWWNPFGTNVNNLSTNGLATTLSDVGSQVVTLNPNSIRNTSHKACKTN